LKNKIIQTKSNRPSCIGYDEKWIMISSEELHRDFESLSNHTKSFHKSGTNGYAVIHLNTLKEIQYHSNHSEFFIRYKSSKSLNLTKHYLSIADDSIRENFCSSLAADCLLLSKKEAPNYFARLLPNLISIIVAVLLTLGARYVANGGVTNARRVIAQLAIDFLQAIGPTIIILAGCLITLYFIFKIIKNFIKPTQRIIYT
jgi:hypothetical protein